MTAMVAEDVQHRMGDGRHHPMVVRGDGMIRGVGFSIMIVGEVVHNVSREQSGFEKVGVVDQID